MILSTFRYIAVAFTCAAAHPQMAFAQSCLSDLDSNRIVNGEDLALVLAQWGPCIPPSLCQADVNADGRVNGIDLANVIASWGSCPPIVPAWATLVESFPDPAVVLDQALRESIVATGLAWRVRDTATQIELVLVPPGTYQRGCSPSQQYGCPGDEFPVHGVTLTQPFYMGRYEVTQAQWQARMGSNPSSFRSPSTQVPAAQVPSRPVESVSWNSIQSFLSVTGMRLPTEAEWEHAYRGGTTTAFHSMPGHIGGTNADTLLGNIAWFSGNAESQTRPVGLKFGNGFGIHDMSGNVWEWVSDWYGTYPSAAQTDPTGPESGSYRVFRGGSRANISVSTRSSARNYNTTPGYTSSNVGFRVARNP